MIVTFDKSIKEISARILKKAFKKADTKADTMRSIILNERDYCDCKYERSQRSFWYSVVKPTLDKLGLLSKDDDKEETMEKWDSKLSKYLKDLVTKGELTYRDIMIADESRKHYVPYSFDFAPYRNIVVVCEKDTIYNIVYDIASVLGCSCLSTKGLNSFGTMENLLRKIKDNTTTDLNRIVFLVMSDYDPTGYIIAHTVKQQALDMVKALDMKCEIVTERIGIVPEQLTEEELENNMYTPKAKGLEEWYHLTNGINGIKKGLELDALSPERIREIFTEHLKDYIDSNDYYENDKQDYLLEQINGVIGQYTRIIKEEVYQKMKDKVVMVREYDITDVAKDNSYVNLDNYFTVDMELVERFVSEYFVLK